MIAIANFDVARIDVKLRRNAVPFELACAAAVETRDIHAGRERQHQQRVVGSAFVDDAYGGIVDVDRPAVRHVEAVM